MKWKIWYHYLLRPTGGKVVHRMREKKLRNPNQYQAFLLCQAAMTCELYTRLYNKENYTSSGVISIVNCRLLHYTIYGASDMELKGVFPLAKTFQKLTNLIKGMSKISPVSGTLFSGLTGELLL